MKGVWFQLHQKSFFPEKNQNRCLQNFKFQIPINDPHAHSPFSFRFDHGGRCMHGWDFIGSMIWGFKFQIKISDLDFKMVILAETYHNWAQIDDAGSPWIYGPRERSNMLIGCIRRVEFISGNILGWFRIFLGAWSDLNPNIQYVCSQKLGVHRSHCIGGATLSIRLLGWMSLL